MKKGWNACLVQQNEFNGKQSKNQVDSETENVVRSEVVVRIHAFHPKGMGTTPTRVDVSKDMRSQRAPIAKNQGYLDISYQLVGCS